MGTSLPKSNGSARICPTRRDNVPALFAHRVSSCQCQERQRDRYHKCFTCAWSNTYVAAHGSPVPVTTASTAPTAAEPVAKDARAPSSVKRLATAGSRNA